MKKHIIKLLALALVCVTAFGIVSCGFSYIEDDISPYATFRKDLYDAISVTIDAEHDVTEAEIDEKIRQNLLGKKEPVNNKEKETEGTIGYGDAVQLWYFGTVDLGDGKTETVRDFAANKIYDNTPGFFVIGGGLRMKDAEKALEGVKIEDYIAKMEGTVETGKVYYVTYYYTSYDKDGKSLGGYTHDGVCRAEAAKLDEVFCKGFTAAFNETVLGKSFDYASGKSFTLEVSGDLGEKEVKRVYSLRMCAQADKSFSVDSATYADDGGLYAGKKVTDIEIQLFSFVDYKVPELNKETAVSLFGISSTSEDPVKDYREKVKTTLLSASARTDAIKDALWTELKKCVTVGEKLPKSKVKQMQKVFMETVEYYYDEVHADAETLASFEEEYGKGSADNLDLFAAAMFDAPRGTSAKDVVKGKAEEWVREDLIVFSLVENSGIKMPGDEIMNEAVNTEVKTLAQDYGVTEEELFDMYGGREYFIASYYRDLILEEMAARVPVQYKAAEK